MDDSEKIEELISSLNLVRIRFGKGILSEVVNCLYSGKEFKNDSCFLRIKRIEKNTLFMNFLRSLVIVGDIFGSKEIGQALDFYSDNPSYTEEFTNIAIACLLDKGAKSVREDFLENFCDDDENPEVKFYLKSGVDLGNYRGFFENHYLEGREGEFKDIWQIIRFNPLVSHLNSFLKEGIDFLPFKEMGESLSIYQ